MKINSSILLYLLINNSIKNMNNFILEIYPLILQKILKFNNSSQKRNSFGTSPFHLLINLRKHELILRNIFRKKSIYI
jgi:hypothetical protein